MGVIKAKKDEDGMCWARLRLESKERILVSLAQTGVKIFKLKWGFLPTTTLWASRSIVEVGEMFFDPDKPFQRPFDPVVERVIVCGSAAEVCAVLTRR